MSALTVLYHDRGHGVDGIRDHTELLGAALEASGGGEVQLQTQVRPRSLDAALNVSNSSIMLQYSPFCYGRWGFAPWLPAALLRLRRRRQRPTLALIVHEPFVPIESVRSALMGTWQRAQLEALRLAADVVFVSIEPWASLLERRRPARPVFHLPVGSNVPDMRRTRAAQRKALGASDDTVVVATLGRRHGGWRDEYASAAMRRIAESTAPVLLLSLGAEAPELTDLDRVRVHTPGHLTAADLARHVAAADLFLAPFVDGVSTRRTSLMAALQHGVAVVGTDGHLTDSLLRDARGALRLAPAGDKEAFADAACSLALSARQRAALGREGRVLYERLFDWHVAAGTVLAALDGHAARPR